MAGGKARRKRDNGVKVASGQQVRIGQILVRNISSYKSGINVEGLGTLFAVREGKVSFARKKTSHGQLRTFVNVIPAKPAA